MALSADQLRKLWLQAGGPPKYATVMARIALRESGGKPQVQNLTYPDHSIGLWQINQLAHRNAYGDDQTLKNPLANARAAVAIFRASRRAGQDPLKPWSTYNPATDIKLIGTNTQPQGSAAAALGQQASGPRASTGSVFDKAGYEKAKRASLVGGLIAKRKGTDSILFRTGLLTTQAPAVSDFVKPGLQQAAVAASTPATGKEGNSPLTAPGSAPDGLRALIERANRIDSKHFNYEWGGGHNPSLAPTHGIGHGSGPGIGFDCSGAVSKVLGINPLVASQFMSWGKPGKGKTVTIYAKGTHVLMEINNHFFGTSGANPGGGAGWIPRSALSASYLSGFVARHPAGM